MGFYSEFNKGIFKENPIFRLLLGICPTLAVTTSVKNGIGMGLLIYIQKDMMLLLIYLLEFQLMELHDLQILPQNLIS